jgi:hypothetical protein
VSFFVGRLRNHYEVLRMKPFRTIGSVLLATIVLSMSRQPRVSAVEPAITGTGKQVLAQPKLIEQSYPLEDEASRARVVKELQQLTVDLLAIQNIYRQNHWNLSGPLYLVLHEYYDSQADFYLD